MNKCSAKHTALNISKIQIVSNSQLGSNDPIKFNELLLANCWLGGSEAIKTNDDLFFDVSQVLGKLVTFKAAKIKNL